MGEKGNPAQMTLGRWATGGRGHGWEAYGVAGSRSVGSETVEGLCDAQDFDRSDLITSVSAHKSAGDQRAPGVA